MSGGILPSIAVAEALLSTVTFSSFSGSCFVFLLLLQRGGGGGGKERERGEDEGSQGDEEAHSEGDEPMLWTLIQQ